MAFSVQAIRYGWVALASLGVITGTTIYVANNQRHQVKPEDIIEIALGTYERCLATQTSTNPTYSVTPPSFVRTWTSNVYTTNGVTVYTNIVTNTIGWHIDRAMMVSLDTTIKALVPFYVDTNTVYDGTTNIVMLTVTGLWASLGIGDHTNQFTRTPCWTNPVSTNWIVNYTSYWPSTNGTAININYTSDYQQVVNYAQSWTATGGHVWVTSSNWASEVVAITNAATYGDYPWQIYVEDLQERYKVLNALKFTSQQTVTKTLLSGYAGYSGPLIFSGTDWSHAKTLADTNWSDTAPYWDLVEADYGFTYGLFSGGQIFETSTNPVTYRYGAAMINGVLKVDWNDYSTDELGCMVAIYVRSHSIDTWRGNPSTSNYYNGGLGLVRDNFTEIFSGTGTSTTFGAASEEKPAWCSEPTLSPPIYEYFYPSASVSYGFGFNDSDIIALRGWDFNYCTIKYW